MSVSMSLPLGNKVLSVGQQSHRFALLLIGIGLREHLLSLHTTSITHQTSWNLVKAPEKISLKHLLLLPFAPYSGSQKLNKPWWQGIELQIVENIFGSLRLLQTASQNNLKSQADKKLLTCTIIYVHIYTYLHNLCSAHWID